MIETLVEVIDVPAAEGTILTLRESASFQRTFVLRNLSAGILTLKVQQSADGGATWTDVGAAIVLQIAGSGSEMQVVNVAPLTILRLRGSGGGTDRDLYVALVRAFLDAGKVWVSPVV